MYYVYILQSIKDGNIYTGYTSNIKLRYLEHKNGLVKSTVNRRPLKLVYFECYINERDARRRESYLKAGGKAKNDLKWQLRDSLLGP
ncbi:MAG: GIY-YIG nuclease family protein [Candidatus Shapirobacteria bacterium]